ncbi:hypothetical protein GG344DRAFT_64006 [Lentinula edodes]|nr:hypothetical protein GG344DRAFT_64006 [Lentinula edodes]
MAIAHHLYHSIYTRTPTQRWFVVILVIARANQAIQKKKNITSSSSRTFHIIKKQSLTCAIFPTVSRSVMLPLRLFFALFLSLSSLLLIAVAAPVADAPKQPNKSLGPQTYEIRLIRMRRVDGKELEITDIKDPVKSDEIWSLKIGSSEFSAVRQPSGKWKGRVITSLLGGETGIILAYATFPSIQKWEEVGLKLGDLSSTSNLEYLNVVLAALKGEKYLHDLNALWRYRDSYDNLSGFYWQMCAERGTAGGTLMYEHW